MSNRKVLKYKMLFPEISAPNVVTDAVNHKEMTFSLSCLLKTNERRDLQT